MWTCVGNGQAVGLYLFHRGGAAGGKGFWFPDLEFVAQTYEHSGIGNPGMRQQFFRQANTTGIVKRKRRGIAENGGSQVILGIGKQVETVQTLGNFLHHVHAKPFEGGEFVGRDQDNALE